MTTRAYRVTTHYPERFYTVVSKEGREIKTSPAHEEVAVLNGAELSEWITRWSNSDGAPTWRVETLTEPEEEQEWYVKKREKVLERVDQIGLEDEPFLDRLSPSGRWRLQAWHTKEDKGWKYTSAVVGKVGDSIEAQMHHTHVIRNYPNFHHGWIEDYHGHDYLLTGEDYQGVTVIELDTLKEAHYIHPEAKRGNGFCFAEYTLLPNDKLQVLGCYWAAPYERVTYDFSDPFNLPWPELYREGAFETDEEDIEQEMRNG